MEYLACGNIAVDRVEGIEGGFGAPNIGGPAFFALTGLRLWTDRCKIVCRTGADFYSLFGSWIETHGISTDSVFVAAENCVQHLIRNKSAHAFEWHSIYGPEHMGYLKVTPEQIDAATDFETKGIYIAQNEDKVFWRALYDIKSRKGFKIMWENEWHVTTDKPSDKLRRTRDVIGMADMWSINISEASRIFNIPQRNEQDIINEMMRLPIEMSLLRMDKNGLWVITGNSAVQCEAIDISETVNPLGCGKTASATALYAHCEGYSPAMVAAMSNVAAGYNAAYEGVIPHITPELMREARETANQYYRKITSKKS